MGGIGSGSRDRWDKKATTESQHRIDVRYMKQHGLLRPGTIGRLFWTRESHQTGSLGYHVEQEELILQYRYSCDGREREEVEEIVRFDRTPCNYGGERIWLWCPHCSRRVAVLYGAGKRFLCRHCYRLAYASQSEGPLDRTLRRANKIRMRLGGEPGMAARFPDRPKGMWRRTYKQLQNQAFEAEMIADEALGSLLTKVDQAKRGRGFWQ